MPRTVSTRSAFLAILAMSSAVISPFRFFAEIPRTSSMKFSISFLSIPAVASRIGRACSFSASNAAILSSRLWTTCSRPAMRSRTTRTLSRDPASTSNCWTCRSAARSPDWRASSSARDRDQHEGQQQEELGHGQTEDHAAAVGPPIRKRQARLRLIIDHERDHQFLGGAGSPSASVPRPIRDPELAKRLRHRRRILAPGGAGCAHQLGMLDHGVAEPPQIGPQQRELGDKGAGQVERLGVHAAGFIGEAPGQCAGAPRRNRPAPW